MIFNSAVRFLFAHRPDLIWGVPRADRARHISAASALEEPYRVGVLTASSGYLIRPSFLIKHVEPSEHRRSQVAPCTQPQERKQRKSVSEQRVVDMVQEEEDTKAFWMAIYGQTGFT